MENLFSAKYKIGYKDVDSNLNAKISNFMEYLQETSVSHINTFGFTPKWYKENMQAFVLTNWQVEIYKYPKVDDIIKIETFPSYFKGVIAERMFQAFDQNENLLIRANSKWGYVDFEKQRPVKIPNDFIKNFKSVSATLLKTDYTLDNILDYEKINSSSFNTTRRDIDSNSHINNLKYFDWIFDLIPDEIYDNNKISEIKIKYKKECKVNTFVTVDLYQNKYNPSMFYGKVFDENTEYVNVNFNTKPSVSSEI